MPVAKPWRKWGLPSPKSEASTGKLSFVNYEVYSGIEVHEWPFFVRLDGWRFHNLTKRLKLKKPFDKRLMTALANSANAFFVSFDPTLCYIFSDELNFLFLKPTSFRRIEKIDSVFSGVLSSNTTEIMGTRVAFDCRVIPAGKMNVIPYLIWRQAECWRNHNNAWAQWTMVERAGLNPRTANKRLEGLKVRELHKLCKTYGVDLNRTPAWQRRGVLLFKESYSKRGYDPTAKKLVVVERRRIKVDWTPVEFDSLKGKIFIRSLMLGKPSSLR